MKRLSMIVCPLCGKQTSLKHFNPSDYDLDIYVQEVRGLGRGRGFETGPRESILGDDHVTPLIKDRLLELSRLLLKEEILKPSEVASLMGGEAALRKRDDTIDELEETVEVLTSELNDAKEELRKRELNLAEWRSAYEKLLGLYNRKGDELKQVASEKEEIEEELEEAQSKVKELEEEDEDWIVDLGNKIEEELKWEGSWDYTLEDDPKEALKERVDVMITEYNELLEATE